MEVDQSLEGEDAQKEDTVGETEHPEDVKHWRSVGDEEEVGQYEDWFDVAAFVGFANF